MLRDPCLRALGIRCCAIAAFYLATLLWQVAQQVADILLLFFLAWLLAYVLEPVVGTLGATHLPRLADTLIVTLPPRAQDDARFLVVNIHRAFSGFLRGQVIQSLVGGVGTGVIMSILQVDYALLASVTAGIVLLIPFLGPVVAVVVPVTIALL